MSYFVPVLSAHNDLNLRFRPRVSVLMPVFNTAQFLTQSIESVLTQSFSDFEFVIADDGSTDGSLSILREYADRDQRVRVLPLSHGGIGAARNAAYAVMQGELIVVMDSDDVMMPGRIAAQVAYLDAHPEMSAVGSQWLYVNTDLTPIHIDCHPTDPEVTRTLTFAYQSLHNPTVCLRRKAIETGGGFDSKYLALDDAGFYARLAVANQGMASLPNVFFKWRCNVNSVTHSHAREQTAAADAVRRTAFAELSQNSPAEAGRIAQRILETFPAGTWFEEKVRSLIGSASRDYLLAALPRAQGDLDALKRLVFRWFDEPAAASKPLEAALRSQDTVVYADLVALNDGRLSGVSDVPAEHPAVPVVAGRAVAPLAIYLAFDGDRQDFLERLEQIALCAVGAVVVAYRSGGSAAGDGTFMQCAVADRDASWLCCQGDLFDAWQQFPAAISCHLPPRHRFDPEILRAAIARVQQGRARLACTSLRHVYPYALVDGVPGIEPCPSPSRSMATLAGQRRLSLASFVYRKELLADFPLPMAALGEFGLEEGLVDFLQHHQESQVVPGHHDFLVDDLRLKDNTLRCLHTHLVCSYFDGGGALPSTVQITDVPMEALAAAVDRCDARFRQGRLLVHPGNLSRLVQAFGRLPGLTWRTRLGRMLWRANTAELVAAWRVAGHPGYARWAEAVGLLLRLQEKLSGQSNTH
ncbi:MAG: glycosyltransferase family 2 protein [Pseudomonadota bacterium]|nr:glycosyltransferase family 2 protein [Pseudomonadota bacterium]